MALLGGIARCRLSMACTGVYLVCNEFAWELASLGPHLVLSCLVLIVCMMQHGCLSGPLTTDSFLEPDLRGSWALATASLSAWATDLVRLWVLLWMSVHLGPVLGWGRGFIFACVACKVTAHEDVCLLAEV